MDSKELGKRREENLLLPSLRRRRTRPLVATPWTFVSYHNDSNSEVTSYKQKTTRRCRKKRQQHARQWAQHERTHELNTAIHTHLDHAKTLLVVSSGDFEDVTRELIAEAFALNSLKDGIKSSSGDANNCKRYKIFRMH